MGRGDTRSQPRWIRAVSSRLDSSRNKSEPNELWEQKRRTLLTSLIDSARLKFPLFESMVSFVPRGGREGALGQRNRGERHSMNFHRGLLLLRPAADFFIDNRDSVTSLRESYGSRSSPPPSPPLLLDSREEDKDDGSRFSLVSGN